MNSKELPQNKCTRFYVVLIVVLIGFTGIIHGISEVFVGNKPTEGFLLKSIGAFTLIHNYLYTGIAAISVSLILIIWSIGYIHKKNGHLIFLILSILLFLVGGGVAQIIGFLLTWSVATNINSTLEWWKKHLAKKTRRDLAKLWLKILITGFALLVIGILIWLFLVPPGALYKSPTIEHICWTFLVAGLGFQIMTIISGFARDLELQERKIIKR